MSILCIPDIAGGDTNVGSNIVWALIKQLNRKYIETGL